MRAPVLLEQEQVLRSQVRRGRSSSSATCFPGLLGSWQDPLPSPTGGLQGTGGGSLQLLFSTGLAGRTHAVLGRRPVV